MRTLVALAESIPSSSNAIRNLSTCGTRMDLQNTKSSCHPRFCLRAASMQLPAFVPIVWAVPILDQPALRRAFLALYERACLQKMKYSVGYGTRYDPIELLIILVCISCFVQYTRSGF